MPEPVSLLAHLRGEGYHPRSSKHGDAMVRAIVEDLMAYCPKIAEHVAAGRLVYNVGHKLRIGMDSWNTDLAIGTAPPSGVLGAVPTLAGMPRAVPVHVRIAVEAKAVMTKHAGARRNRKRDLEAHHDHVHRYRTETVAAGLTIVNASSSFYSPVPPEGMRYHRQPRDAEGVVDVMRGVTRSVGIGRPGMDALGVLVVEMDNVERASTRYVVKPPAPQPGDPFNWDTFIADICAAYDLRYS
jgi:hypothetical protein